MSRISGNPEKYVVMSTDAMAAFESSEIEQSLAARFEKVAAVRGDHPAVTSGGRVLTYSELNAEANRIAHAVLAARGDRPEPVGLLLDDAISMTAAIYGVLKAGKTYVPLDPYYPSARLAYMVDDSGAGLVIAESATAPLAGEIVRPDLGVLDVREIGSGVSTQNPGVDVSPEAIGWILYTSGSTGKPKGVAMKNRSVLHSMRRTVACFGLRLDYRVAMLESFSSSGSQTAYLGALLAGACMSCFDVKRHGIAPLAAWVEKENLTVWLSVPTLLRHFARSLPEGKKLETVRVVRLGGEPSTMREVEIFRKHFRADSILSNGYGSTESGHNTQFWMRADTPVEGNSLPIGYPLEDIEILLLDENRNPVSPGEAGEIAVKMRYLAEGYVGKPEATAEKFLADPAGDAERIYLTGDLGRMEEGGYFMNLGRKDFQVKIRGFRIETPEIEKALEEIDGVRESVVTARSDSKGEQRLVGYVVAEDGAAPTVTTLRRVLSKSLPDYMIPSAFVMLDSLPVSGTGKTDRKALPEPDGLRPALDVDYAAPRTPVEREIAAIWAETLGLDEIGVNDEFLDLGGNSLVAAAIVSRVLERFSVHIDLSQLMETPTVADMAVSVTKHLARQAGTDGLESLISDLESPLDGPAQ